jgi:hypothetical protein
VLFDWPLPGREFFEEIIRDNLDLGRLDRVRLIFDRERTSTMGLVKQVITLGLKLKNL